ncbi:hypothetical protein ABBQ38_014088 [Trebouxia sp. C0009 RCD-2024]
MQTGRSRQCRLLIPQTMPHRAPQYAWQQQVPAIHSATWVVSQTSSRTLQHNFVAVATTSHLQQADQQKQTHSHVSSRARLYTITSQSVSKADFPEHAQHASNASMLCHEGTQPCQYEPDTALVNFYREGDTLGGHKDDAEDHSDCPIVSLSLGCDAVFLIGGATKDVAPTAVWLHSGDAVVLSGPARQCYHGVPRVLPGRMLFDGTAPACAKEVAAYMQTTRVNLSIRQT